MILPGILRQIMCNFRWFGLFIFFLVAGVLLAYGQDADQGKSLGDVARDSRAQSRESRAQESAGQNQLATQLYRLLTTAKQESAQQRWDDAARDLHTVIEQSNPCTDTNWEWSKAHTQLASNEYSQGHRDRALAIIEEKTNKWAQCSGQATADEVTIVQERAVFERIVNDDKNAEVDFLKVIAIREKTGAGAKSYPADLLLLTDVYERQELYRDIIALLTPRMSGAATSEHDSYGTWARLWQALGEAHQKLGQYEQAEKAYNTAMGLTAPERSLLADMASLYHAMGKEAEAQKVEASLNAMPSSTPQIRPYPPPPPRK